MSTKRYYRISFGSLFFQVVTLAAFCGGVVILANAPNVDRSGWTSKDWGISVFIYAVVALCLPLLAYLESTFWVGPIRLEGKQIRSRGDNRLPKEKIQYPTSVAYEEIAEVAIVPLRRNSKNGYLRLARPIPYLRIKRKNGKTALFSLHFMSRGIVRKLIAELQNRVTSTEHGASINPNQLLDDFSKARWATKEWQGNQ